jgi:hypothetical protein
MCGRTWRLVTARLRDPFSFPVLKKIDVFLLRGFAGLEDVLEYSPILLLDGQENGLSHSHELVVRDDAWVIGMADIACKWR